jgi:hypothetical protein
MKIDLEDGHSLYLLNFSSDQRDTFAHPAREIYRLTAGRFGFPTLRSREIYVFNNLHDDFPRYLSEPAAEFISVHVERDLPSKFAYQLAHETGHLLSQNWRRFQKPGFYSWIEEALCGTHSIYCTRKLLEQPGWFQTNSQPYLDYFDQTYPVTVINADWYKTNKDHLAAASSLTDTIKQLSRLIADRFPDGQFVADNIALIETPPKPTVQEYLHEWQSRCRSTSNVAKLLISLLGLAREPKESEASEIA